MKVNFEFEDKDIKVNFENNYKLKDQTTEKGIKVLMLKGEKGDPGQDGAEWGKINGTLSEQIDLKNALDKKADKTDIPTKTSQLENDSGFLIQHQDLTNYAKKEDIPDVSNFITKSINDLENYYLKSETYTQTEVNQMISSIPKFAIEVVETLPTAEISNTTIYLLTSGTETGNLYTEYIYVNNSWEKLGTQTVDLTNYYTKEEVNSLLSNIDLSSYYTKTETNTLLNAKLNITDLISFVYPVGSIYMSVNNVSPATFMGGTWTQIKDRFLLACGSTYKAGATGGEEKHKLTKSEIPNYTIGTIPEAVPFNHNNWNNGGITSGDLGKASSSKKGVANNNDVLTIVSDTQWGYKISTDGGGQPHNNMPPYLAVYMWKRTA